MKHLKIISFCRLAFLSLLLLPLCAVVSCVDESEPAATGTIINVGDELPAFSVVTNSGDTLSLDSLRQRRSVIAFFHTGCPDCRRTLPVLDSLYRVASVQSDFRMVCISRAEAEHSVSAYWQQAHFAMPYAAQPDRTLYDRFAHTGVPRIYVADTATVVRAVFDDSHVPTLAELLAVVR